MLKWRLKSSFLYWIKMHTFTIWNIGAKVKARIDAQALRNFLPEDTSMYFRYNGSLTTPGCFESVIWTVFDQKQAISHRQVHRSCHFKTYVNYGLAMQEQLKSYRVHARIVNQRIFGLRVLHSRLLVKQILP